MNVIVICLNDYQIGVYSDRRKARVRCEPKYPPVLIYRMHEFKVDAEAEA